MHAKPEAGMQRPDFAMILRKEVSRLTKGYPGWKNALPAIDLVTTRYNVGYYDEPIEDEATP